MKRIITDAEVAALPLGAAKDDLLEEIMAIDHGTARRASGNEPEHGSGSTPVATPMAFTPAVRRRRWVSVAAVAAAVVGIAAAAGLGGLVGGGGEDRAASPAGPESVVPSIAVLDAPGWTLDNAQIGEAGGSLDYRRGQTALEIRWTGAASYLDYIDDREMITAPTRTPGEPLTVLGRTGSLWAYSADDHTVIAQPQGPYFLEFRGEGLSETDYRALLRRLRGIGLDQLDRFLPPEFITSVEQPRYVAALLDGVPVPRGLDTSTLRSREVERNAIAFTVLGRVACGWIDQYVAGLKDDDPSARKEAQRALSTARRWKGLSDGPGDDGGPASILQDYADAVVQGTVPAGYHSGLGC